MIFIVLFVYKCLDLFQVVCDRSEIKKYKILIVSLERISINCLESFGKSGLRMGLFQIPWFSLTFIQLFRITCVKIDQNAWKLRVNHILTPEWNCQNIITLQPIGKKKLKTVESPLKRFHWICFCFLPFCLCIIVLIIGKNFHSLHTPALFNNYYFLNIK